MSPEYLLAIDGGQTATKALLAWSDGTVLAQGTGGPFDHFHVAGGLERNRAAIHGAIAAVFAAAGLDPQPIGAAVLGLTGVQEDEPEGALAEAMVREMLPAGPIRVVPDYVTSLAGASSGRPGVVVIAGGGAIAYGVTADGRTARSGGWGYLLGDEGSAYDIGRRGVIAALRAYDRRGPPTALQALVARSFGLQNHDLAAIKRIVYAAGFSRERFSALAPRVAGAARDGDPVARAIMQGAGQELALAALAVVQALFAPDERVSVYPTGGVFTAGDQVLAPFRVTLASGWPLAVVAEPDFPPVAGALIMARRLSGHAADASWLARVRETMDCGPPASLGT